MGSQDGRAETGAVANIPLYYPVTRRWLNYAWLISLLMAGFWFVWKVVGQWRVNRHCPPGWICCYLSLPPWVDAIGVAGFCGILLLIAVESIREIVRLTRCLRSCLHTSQTPPLDRLFK